MSPVRMYTNISIALSVKTDKDIIDWIARQPRGQVSTRIKEAIRQQILREELSKKEDK